MNAQEKSQKILDELTMKHSTGPLEAELLAIPSCGLIGDNRVYGYAWGVKGIDRFDSESWQGVLKEMGTRLTNEVIADDETRFVRVFVEIPLLPVPEKETQEEKEEEEYNHGEPLV